MPEFYYPLKLVHMGLALLSISFFILRSSWSITGAHYLQKPLIKISPHIIDTFLLLSAIILAALSHQYPLQQSWLTAKVIALCLYIIFGSMAIKRARTVRAKVIFTALALLTFGYIVLVAFIKKPFPTS